MVATVPGAIARDILALRPHLAIAGLPFPSGGVAVALPWPREVDDDSARAYVRDLIARRRSRLDGAGRTRLTDPDRRRILAP